MKLNMGMLKLVGLEGGGMMGGPHDETWDRCYKL